MNKLNDLLYAVDEDNHKLLFGVVEDGNILNLTLKKEKFLKAKKLRILCDLAKAKAGDPGFFVIPRNIEMTGDQLIYFNRKHDCTFEERHALTNTFFVDSPSFCGIVCFGRSYHYKLVTEIQNGIYSCYASLNLTKNDSAYKDIEIRLIQTPREGGYSAMAVKYREFLIAEGCFVPLTEKYKRAAVEYAGKNPLIRIRMGWKESPSPVLHQNTDNEPPMYVACTFKKVREFADCLSRTGVKGAEIQLVGWNKSGHDGRYPQLFPVEEKLGGETELRKTIEYLKRLGYRVSLHTNLIDMYEIADTFTWDDAALGRNGKPIQIGRYSGGLAYRVCYEKQLKNVKRDLPAVAEFETDGLHFIDVVSIVEPDVCFSSAHPVSSARGIEIAREIMSYASSLLGGFSSEGCFDFSMRTLDFGLYTTFGDGFGKKAVPTADCLIPFYELLIHGITLYNPESTTVNYLLKTPRDRLDFYMRGGRPVIYLYSKFRTGQTNWMGEDDYLINTSEDMRSTADAVARVCREYSRVSRLQTVFMNDYSVYDNGLHVSKYADGTVIAGNYSDKELFFEGFSISPYDYIMIEKKSGKSD